MEHTHVQSTRPVSLFVIVTAETAVAGTYSMHLFLPLAVYGASVLVAATLVKKVRTSVAVLPCCTDTYADYVDAKPADGVTVTW